jgi:hypothetical protein
MPMIPDVTNCVDAREQFTTNETNQYNKGAETEGQHVFTLVITDHFHMTAPCTGRDDWTCTSAVENTSQFQLN